MSVQDHNRGKMLEALKSSTVSYDLPKAPSQTDKLTDQGDLIKSESLSALQILSQRIELCLKKQIQVRFITKEIAEIIKKSS